MEKIYKFKIITETVQIFSVAAVSGSLALQRVENHCDALKDQVGYESINITNKIYTVDNQILNLIFKIRALCQTLKEFVPEKRLVDGFNDFTIFYNPSADKIILPHYDFSLEGFFREDVTELSSSRLNYDKEKDIISTSSCHPLWYFNEEFLKDIIIKLFNELKQLEVV